MKRLLVQSIFSLALAFAGSSSGEIGESPEVIRDETKAPKLQKGKASEVQKDNAGIKQFGEEVASRLDRIVKKKAFDLWGDPWTIQGVPVAFPSDSTGFNLGLRVAVQNIRRQDPHKFELETQVLASDGGRYKHFVRIDYPWIMDGRFRLTARASYSARSPTHFSSCLLPRAPAKPAEP